MRGIILFRETGVRATTGYEKNSKSLETEKGPMTRGNGIEGLGGGRKSLASLLLIGEPGASYPRGRFITLDSYLYPIWKYPQIDPMCLTPSRARDTSKCTNRLDYTRTKIYH